jgi:hypothetical protein
MARGLPIAEGPFETYMELPSRARARKPSYPAKTQMSVVREWMIKTFTKNNLR